MIKLEKLKSNNQVTIKFTNSKIIKKNTKIIKRNLTGVSILINKKKIMLLIFIRCH